MDKCKECGSDYTHETQDEIMWCGCPKCDHVEDADGQEKCSECGNEELDFGFDDSNYLFCNDCGQISRLTYGGWISA